MKTAVDKDGWNVYIIENVFGDRYIGISTNLEERLRSHRTGFSSSSFMKAPETFQLIDSIFVDHFILASKIERYLHRLSKENKKKITFHSEFLADFISKHYSRIDYSPDELVALQLIR